jgi:protocadherin delta 1
VCSIKFDVLVVCTAGCFNIISVAVDVLDINDQTPTFIDQSSSAVNLVTITLPESSAAGSQFALPTAHDADSPAFGVQRVDLFPVEARSTFALLRRRSPTVTSSSSQLQLVLTEALDRELVSQYHLTIVATDGGQPPLSATCSVVVVVSDVNDNDPIFQQSLYSADVSENATQGQFICSLRHI